MAWDGSVELSWGGEDRRFRLGIKELVAIESDTDTGVIELYRQLGKQEARITAVRAILKYGLEGGGLSPNKTRFALDRYFDEGGPQAFVDHYIIALRVLEVALTMPRELEDQDSGKAEGDGKETTDSPSPSSTATAS